MTKLYKPTLSEYFVIDINAKILSHRIYPKVDTCRIVMRYQENSFNKESPFLSLPNNILAIQQINCGLLKLRYCDSYIANHVILPLYNWKNRDLELNIFTLGYEQTYHQGTNYDTYLKIETISIHNVSNIITRASNPIYVFGNDD